MTRNRLASRWIARILSLSLPLLALPVEAQTSGRDEEARAVYQAGLVAYDGGRYDEALRHFQSSYELSGRPGLLYNIATAAERTRDDALALESYAAFLEAVPDTPLRERVETRISQIRAQQAREEAARAEAARAEAERAEAERAEAERAEAARGEGAGAEEETPRRAVPFALVGGGAAVTVAGAVLLGIGASDRAKVESPAPGSRDWDADGARAYERGPRLATAGWVAAPLGVAALAVGTILVIKRGRASGGDASEEDGVALDLGLGTLTLRGSF